MFLHHELGWWGFVLAVVALVLAYPLDVLAHLSSPIIRNWWAERSLKSLQKRIEKLENEKRIMDLSPLFTDSDLRIMKSIRSLAFLVSQSIHLVLFALFLLAIPKEQRFILWSVDRSTLVIQGVGIFIIATNFAGYLVVMRSIGRDMQRGSTRYRGRMTATIAKLRSELESRTKK
jgi:hypothetical protein